MCCLALVWEGACWQVAAGSQRPGWSPCEGFQGNGWRYAHPGVSSRASHCVTVRSAHHAQLQWCRQCMPPWVVHVCCCGHMGTCCADVCSMSSAELVQWLQLMQACALVFWVRLFVP
jgi:hypothetical protein